MGFAVLFLSLVAFTAKQQSGDLDVGFGLFCEGRVRVFCQFFVPTTHWGVFVLNGEIYIRRE